MGYLVDTPHFKICYNTPVYPDTKQEICFLWCQFCRWPRNKEKSTRTLDFLPQWTYYMEKQQTTNDSSFHNRGWTRQFCHSTSYNEDIGKHGIPTGWSEHIWNQSLRLWYTRTTWGQGTQEPNISSWRSNGSRITCRKETSRYIMWRQVSIWLTSLKRPYLKRPSSLNLSTMRHTHTRIDTTIEDHMSRTIEQYTHALHLSPPRHDFS
jgi:hypothetical protein